MALPTLFGSETEATGGQLDQTFAIIGAMAVTACIATGTNALTLTPLANQPVVSAYGTLQLFSFEAPANSTGLVTIRVGSLAFVKAFAGGAQIDSGGIVMGMTYLFAYQADLDSNAGGMSLIGPGASGGGGGAVSSWNGRTGAVALLIGDVNTVLSGSSSVNISPTGSASVTINPAVTGAEDNVVIGGSNPKSAKFAGQGFTVLPTDNINVPTKTSLNVQPTLNTPGVREFAVNIGIQPSAGGGDKVALFAGCVPQLGSSNAWCMNTVMWPQAGTGTYTAQGYELDIYNDNASVHAIALSIAVNSTAAQQVSSAIEIDVVNSALSYGINFALGGPTFASYIDSGTASKSIDIQGTHVYGIDLASGTLGTAIRIPHGVPITAFSGSTDVALIQMTTGPDIIIGDANTAGHSTFFSCNVLPFSDNTKFCGAGSPTNLAWAEVASYHYTTVSDPSVKTDIDDMPDGMLDIVCEWQPKTFRYRVGGHDIVEVDEEIEAPETEIKRETIKRPVMQADGTVRLVEETVEREVEVFDVHSVLDDAGNPVTVPAKMAKRQVLGADGEPILTAVEPVMDDNGKILLNPDGSQVLRGGEPVTEEYEVVPAHPMVHRERRMKRIVRKVEKQVPRAGVRLHYGFDATQMSDPFEKRGAGFGGHVKGERHGIRNEQVVAVLTKALQEETASRRALEARLAALEAKLTQ